MFLISVITTLCIDLSQPPNSAHSKYLKFLDQQIQSLNYPKKHNKRLAIHFYDSGKKYRINPLLLISVAKHESDLNQLTTGFAANEIGLMQIHPKWSKFYGCRHNKDLESYASYNIDCGAKELAYWRKLCKKQYTNRKQPYTVKNWLGAYNTGKCNSTISTQYTNKVMKILRQIQPNGQYIIYSIYRP